jgi:hypothetical protein
MLPKVCSDCGKTPIPRLEVVFIGDVILCSACAHAPPKTTTLYHGGCSGLWWNQSAGGKPVEYVRADLVDALIAALPKCTSPGCNRLALRAWDRGSNRYCDECALADQQRVPDEFKMAPDYPRAVPLRALLKARPLR